MGNNLFEQKIAVIVESAHLLEIQKAVDAEDLTPAERIIIDHCFYRMYELMAEASLHIESAMERLENTSAANGAQEVGE